MDLSVSHVQEQMLRPAVGYTSHHFLIDVLIFLHNTPYTFRA